MEGRGTGPRREEAQTPGGQGSADKGTQRDTEKTVGVVGGL